MATLSVKKLLRQTAISAMLSFLTFAFGFVRVSYFSKKMTMEDFGMLSLLLSYSAFLMYGFTLGSFQYLFRSVNQGEAEKRSAFWSALSLTAIVSFTGTLVAFLFSESICRYLNISAYQTDFQLIVLATATTSLMMVFLFYHYGLGRNNFQNLLQFLRGSLWVIVAILASLFLQMTLTQTLIIFNLCIFVILLLSVPWRELPALFVHPIKESSLRPLLRYCLPLFPYFAGVWGIPTIIRSQLNIYAGAKNVALFNVGYTLMEIVFLFVSSITSTLSPYFFAASDQENKPYVLYNIMLKYSVLLVLLIIPFIYITRFDLIVLLTSKKYLPAGNFIPMLLVLPLLRMLILVFEQVYLKESKTFFLGTVHALAILLSLFISTFLIPKYGIAGAIYSALFSYLFLFICLYWKQSQQIDYAYQKLGAVSVFCISVWAAVLLMNLFHFNSFLKTLPLALIAGLGLRVLPVFSQFEKQKILSILKIKYVSR